MSASIVFADSKRRLTQSVTSIDFFPKTYTTGSLEVLLINIGEVRNVLEEIMRYSLAHASMTVVDHGIRIDMLACNFVYTTTASDREG